MGAISMYALALAAEAPSAILDWNNNYGREADKCVCTHCGNFPKELHRRRRRRFRELDVLGTVLGKENCFGAVKGKVKAGPDDLFPRLDGRPRRHDQGLCRRRASSPTIRFRWTAASPSRKVARLRPLLGFIARNGFEHHVAMVRGHHAEAVHEAVARYLEWPIYRHGDELTPPPASRNASSSFKLL